MSKAARNCDLGVVIIHGVAEAEQGENIEALVDTISKLGDEGFAAEQWREVHRIRTKDDANVVSEELPVVLKHATYAGNDVTFGEVYWADTTRVDVGKLSALLAAFRVVFEAHYFINPLVGAKQGSLIRNLLARLLHLATFLIRGPIAGINVALLAIAAVYLYGQSIRHIADPKSTTEVMSLSGAVLVMSALLCLASIYIALKKRRVGDIASLEVAVWVALVTFSATAWLSYREFFGLPLPPTASSYGIAIFAALEYLWMGYCYIIVLSSVLAWAITMNAASDRRAAVWLAVALVVLQGGLWVLFISVPALPLIGWAKYAGLTMPNVEQMQYGFLANAILLVVVGLVALSVVKKRSKISSGCAASLEDLADEMPRLVLSPRIVKAILFAGLANVVFSVLFGYGLMAQIVSTNIYAAMGVVLFVTAVAILLYAVIDTRAFANIIHIVRDLIDHHYRPRSSFVYTLLPGEIKAKSEFPRRDRLRHRTGAVVSFLKDRRCKSLAIVAHSQGSVIAFDFLRRLISEPGLAQKGTSVVTFGSPLEHIYAKYFRSYSELSDDLSALRRPISKWSNIYRVNDFIGNRIGQKDGFVENTAIAPSDDFGGHTNYWRDQTVASTVLRAIADATSSLKNQP